MRPLVTILDRLVPALLMAASVTLLTAGLLSYAPSTFGEWQTPEPELIGGDPLLTLLPSTTPLTPPDSDTPVPTVPESEPPASSFWPTTSPPPATNPAPTTNPPLTTNAPPTPRPTDTPVSSPTSSAGQVAVASRIRIPSLGIDLPVVASDLVVRGNPGFYPLCDVAMFMRGYVQPGEPGATYIYAHAQRGMFAPLLSASQVNGGKSMLGALIEVYTSDNMLHLYELNRVKRHAIDLSITHTDPGVHILVLQTSEGVSGTIPKLQVAARPLAVVPASATEANPTPHPRVCLPR